MKTEPVAAPVSTAKTVALVTFFSILASVLIDAFLVVLFFLGGLPLSFTSLMLMMFLSVVILLEYSPKVGMPGSLKNVLFRIVPLVSTLLAPFILIGGYVLVMVIGFSLSAL